MFKSKKDVFLLVFIGGYWCLFVLQSFKSIYKYRELSVLKPFDCYFCTSN